MPTPRNLSVEKSRNLWPLAIAYALIFAFVAVLFRDAIAETGRRPDPDEVSIGAALYETYCLACHQKDGKGEPPIPWSIRRPGFFTAMPLDETSHAWHHGDEQLISFILDGTRNSRTRMPRWRGILSEQNAADLVAYLKSLWSDRILACQGPAHMQCM